MTSSHMIIVIKRNEKNVTHLRSRGGVIFSIYTAVNVYVCLSVSEQTSSRTDASIFTQFLTAYYTSSDAVEIGDLGSKVKVTIR